MEFICKIIDDRNMTENYLRYQHHLLFIGNIFSL